MDDKWTLGVIIGLPLLAVAVLILLLFIIGGIVVEELFVSVTSFIVLLFVAAGAGFAYWPWKGDYHKWRYTEGVVSEVAKRLIPAGEHGMQERIVLVVNGQQYGCDDTRCAVIKPHDIVQLRCKKQFQWGSTDGYECRFIGHRRAA